MKKIIDQLSSHLGDRTQNPNKALAHEIITSQNEEALNVIRKTLKEETDIDTIADLLKVLEVMGELDSGFSQSCFPEIFQHLNHSSNKIQWRAMSALSTIAEFHTDKIYTELPLILNLMELGTVVTRDHGVKILLCLYSSEKYQQEIAPLLAEQVLGAPDNQVGQYAEKWSKIINQEHIPLIVDTLEARATELDKPTHQKRASKILLSLRKKYKR